MTRIFLIRHAEPAASWGGADDDPGLSERGRVQADVAATLLGMEGSLGLVSSPMLRCRETAAALAHRVGVGPRIEPRVSEVIAPPGIADRPAWLRSNFVWADGKARRQWTDLAPALRTWRDEAVAAVSSIEDDCAVFTHFIAINAIVGALQNSPDTIVFRPGHASITELERTGSGVRVVRLGAEMASEDVR
jgi:broad specificity phosphatase PhoE